MINPQVWVKNIRHIYVKIDQEDSITSPNWPKCPSNAGFLFMNSQMNFPRSETWAKQLIFDQFSFLKSPFLETLLYVLFFHFLLILIYDIENIQIVFSCFHCCIKCDILKPFYCYFYHLVATLVTKSKKFGKNSTRLFHSWRARRREHYTFIKEAWFALAFIFGLFLACMSTSCIV